MKTSDSSGPSSAPECDCTRLKAILSLWWSAETVRGESPKGEFVLEALSDGELGGVEEKERRGSACGLRLKSCRVRAKIVTRSLPNRREGCKDPGRSAIGGVKRPGLDGEGV